MRVAGLLHGNLHGLLDAFWKPGMPEELSTLYPEGTSENDIRVSISITELVSVSLCFLKEADAPSSEEEFLALVRDLYRKKMSEVSVNTHHVGQA